MKRITDERILAGKKHINSSAFGFTLIGLWLIILYRQFVLQQEIGEYVDIFLLTIGISLYVTISNIINGYYLTYRKKSEQKRVVIVGALVGTIVFSLTQFLFVSEKQSIWFIILQAVIFFIVWTIAQTIFLRSSKKNADKDIE